MALATINEFELTQKIKKDASELFTDLTFLGQIEITIIINDT